MIFIEHVTLCDKCYKKNRNFMAGYASAINLLAKAEKKIERLTKQNNELLRKLHNIDDVGKIAQAPS